MQKPKITESNDNNLSPILEGSADRQTLHNAYIEAYHRSPPRRASTGFLRGNMAWANQAQAAGQDPIILLKELIDGLQAIVDRQNGKPTLSLGTRLVREWHGVVHEVTVTDQGYCWKEQTFGSLTAVAWAITGQKTSGPRFFGLKKQPS